MKSIRQSLDPFVAIPSLFIALAGLSITPTTALAHADHPHGPGGHPAVHGQGVSSVEGEEAKDDEAGGLEGIKDKVGDLLRIGRGEDEAKNDAPKPSPLVKRLLDDNLLGDDEKRQLRIFHGRWDDLETTNVKEAAKLALLKRDLHHASLADDQADVLVRAKAALLRGEANTVPAMLANDERYEAKLIVARSYMERGQRAAAAAALRDVREFFQHENYDSLSAAELTAGAEAIVLMARLEGRSGLDDFRLALSLLEKAREEADPLYWPAMVAEARILLGKSNLSDATKAAGQALSLNPYAAEALQVMGDINVGRFNFAGAEEIVSRLRTVNPTHMTADAIATASSIRQKDPNAAREIIDPALERYPTSRQLLKLKAQTEALAYDNAAREAVVEQFLKLAPGSAEIHYALGDFYADARQYVMSIERLNRALEIEPGWSEPRVVLGKTLMQQGDLPAAARELRQAQAIDPSHVEIVNYLKLVDRMLGWKTFETDHFIIRFRTEDPQGNASPDEVWARDVARTVDEMADELIELYEFEPTVKTQLDLMPDDYHFSVRIAGLAETWTVGAATGDVIAMTAPRVGINRQFETYDWLLVLRHEYVHTVTLGKTNNRIPHWFTEGFAVDQETTGRSWERHELLSKALHEDWLFSYDEISWGFIRPKRPFDRSLAYAQAGWIIDFIEEHYGERPLLEMMELQAAGETNASSLKKATGLTVAEFDEKFATWAAEQVTQWGMNPPPDEEELKEALKKPGDIDDEQLASLLEAFPDEPALLKIQAERLMDADEVDFDAAFAALEAFREARPVDPWADKMTVKLAAQQGDLDRAVDALERLDTTQMGPSEYASQLAKVHRDAKRYDKAAYFINRALAREPFNASFRERAVRIALLGQRLQEAVFQLESLAILEPSNATHQVRLAYVHSKLANPEAAAEAAKRAKELDPEAPVDHLIPEADEPEAPTEESAGELTSVI